MGVTFEGKESAKDEGMKNEEQEITKIKKGRIN